MCRYASPDQPRPQRCIELRSPCDECAAEEQAKMDELGAVRLRDSTELVEVSPQEEHMKCQVPNLTLPDLKGP